MTHFCENDGKGARLHSDRLHGLRWPRSPTLSISVCVKASTENDRWGYLTHRNHLRSDRAPTNVRDEGEHEPQRQLLRQRLHRILPQCDQARVDNHRRKYATREQAYKEIFGYISRSGAIGNGITRSLAT